MIIRKTTHQEGLWTSREKREYKKIRDLEIVRNCQAKKCKKIAY